MSRARGAPPEILRSVFGFPAFRGLQEAAVAHVVDGGDALVLMPTGGGKSLCYQLPALCRPGTAIVISPLIALMDDQVAALSQLGVAAAALHSQIDPEAARRISQDLAAGRLELLYVSPERLLSNGTIERLTRLQIALIAIDEAHCVSQWGHEFRHDYRELACLPQHFPGVPRIALTATADPRTRVDILQSLGMNDARVFSASFHRTNLHIAAEPKDGETTQLLRFLKARTGECGIVYCASRAKTERTTQKLQDKGIPAIAFHAGLATAEKQAALARFRSGEPIVMVATIAFGMGIDRPDVRFVVHLDMPDSPEAYYQQVGRAGRDGDRADTLLLYGSEDIARARNWQAKSVASEAHKRVSRARLEAMIGLTETADCRTRSLLACFGEALPEDCGHCDLCLKRPVMVDGTTAAQKVLSAVYRTAQIFGALHIIAVLRGEKTEPVQRHGHDRLTVFGIGADRAAPFWRGVIRQLVARGALDIDMDGHGGLFLATERARPILRGEERVMLREDEGQPPAPIARPLRPARADSPANPADPDTFEALRTWRSTEARAQGLPPYVIFHDSVLRDIAAVRPASLNELAQIKGVGASKLERYGSRVLTIVSSRGA